MALSDGERRGVRIAVVTALPLETASLRTVLGDPPAITVDGAGAGRRYWMLKAENSEGKSQSVVIAECGMGNTAAAVRATQLQSHFPNLQSVIMCGIAGGVPNPAKPEEHVRLGDIVVSDQKGVVKYDFVKRTGMFTEDTKFQNHRPSAEILEASRTLESDRLMGKYPWRNWIADAESKLGMSRPQPETDVLVDSTNTNLQVTHPVDPDREIGHPRVFFGPIASADTLLKDPIKRDSLRTQFGARAVEMEGAGVQDATWSAGNGYFVVRGICDYCDRNKNDLWQPYAAIIAAAYVRCLLELLLDTSLDTDVQQNGMDSALPPPPSCFTGRAIELSQIGLRLRGLAGPDRSVSIRGMPGVGKTAAALKVCAQVVGEYPDGQVFVDLMGMSDTPMSEIDAMTQIIQAINPDQKELSDKKNVLLSSYRRTLSKTRAIIVLDNARDESQVRSLLTASRTNAFIITSRSAFAIEGVGDAILMPLDAGDSLHLLKSIAGTGRSESDLREVASLCGNLPLAIRVAGDFLRLHSNWTTTSYSKELRDFNSRRLLLKGSSPESDVDAVFALSARQLAMEAPLLAERWQMLSVFPTSFDLGAAGVVFEEVLDNLESTTEIEHALSQSLTEARITLTSLLDRGLLLYDTKSDRYSLHDLLRDVASRVFEYSEDSARRSQSEARLSLAEHRHAEYYAAMMDAFSETLEDVFSSLRTRRRGKSASQGPSNDGDEEKEYFQNLVLDASNLSAALKWVMKRFDQDSSAQRIGVRFVHSTIDVMSRVIGFAIDHQAELEGENAAQWLEMTTSPSYGEFCLVFARYFRAVALWTKAWRFAEVAIPSLRIHNVGNVPIAEDIIRASKDQLGYPSLAPFRS